MHFDEFREPGRVRMMVKMADAEVLLDDVSDFGDALVPLFFISGQLSAPGRFSHDAVLNLVKAQEVAVFFSKIAFVGKYLFDQVWGMTTPCDAKRQIGAVMEGRRGHFRGKDKAITGADDRLRCLRRFCRRDNFSRPAVQSGTN